MEDEQNPLLHEGGDDAGPKTNSVADQDADDDYCCGCCKCCCECCRCCHCNCCDCSSLRHESKGETCCGCFPIKFGIYAIFVIMIYDLYNFFKNSIGWFFVSSIDPVFPGILLIFAIIILVAVIIYGANMPGESKDERDKLSLSALLVIIAYSLAFIWALVYFMCMFEGDTVDFSQET